MDYKKKPPQRTSYYRYEGKRREEEPINQKKSRKKIKLGYVFVAIILAAAIFFALQSIDQKPLFGSDHGYEAQLEAFVTEYDTTLQVFHRGVQKTTDTMSDEELRLINEVRTRFETPSDTTTLVKILTQSDLIKYSLGKEVSLRGFVYRFKDVTGLNTPEAIIEGLSLTYENSPFTMGDHTVGVITFQAENAENLMVPKSKHNGGSFIEGYPFGGAGFTTGSDEIIGVPEWLFVEKAKITSATLYELKADGTWYEMGIYDESTEQFIS